MGSTRKNPQPARSTLKVPPASRDGSSGHRGVKAHAADTSRAPARRPLALTHGLQDLLIRSLWPMVEGAFKGADESAEACFYRLGDLQVVISRASGRDAKHHEVGKRVTLELWPLAGPRVLVVEWIGRRPHVVHRRSGPWLQRLVRIARQSKPSQKI
jgi:hypothetical protein